VLHLQNHFVDVDVVHTNTLLADVIVHTDGIQSLFYVKTNELFFILSKNLS
jgi:hypothetical protein